MTSERLTFRYCLSQGTLFVQDDLLVPRLDEMVDDVRCRGVPTRVAEPFVANDALDSKSAF